MRTPDHGSPLLHSKIEIPAELRLQTEVEGRPLDFGGDLRIGDLRGGGVADFLIYRSVESAHDGGGMKPCFLGAFSGDGQILWRVGADGEQPARPGPVVLYDIDGDGRDEVICFFVNPDVAGGAGSMENVVVQIRDGATGELRRQAAPAPLRRCRGQGPNWVHQRLLIANLRGEDAPRDFVVKLGDQLLAFDDDLEVLWSYAIRWNEYGRCAAYIPAVGEIDGDGRDEVNGGYFLLDEDGTPLWENPLAPHMDSVAIAPWDQGRTRAICSGGGHVLDARGEVVLRLGPELVPHGQEVRVARFIADEDEPQMIVRYDGHAPALMVVGTGGRILHRFSVNVSPNNTGMEAVYWQGMDRPALLCNGGVLWDPSTGEGVPLPELPAPVGPARMGWYHCVPADLCGDAREEVLLYNPWDKFVYLYTPRPFDEKAYAGYRSTPRQYNARLMD